jgi:hypothetical protein
VRNDGITPSWVVARQVRATDILRFAPVRRSHAKTLDHYHVRNVLRACFDHVDVIDIYEVCDDVWHVIMLDAGVTWDMFVYEHMGLWEVSSITKRVK